MNIRYKSLTIRDATSADSVQLAAWWNSGRIMAHAGFPNGLKTTAEKIASDISNSTGCHRLILEQYGKPIGEASYRTVPAEADESEQQLGSSAAAAEIGIKICDFTKQEQGLGKIFLTMLISELFRLGYAKIVLDTNLRNKRAQHVYERLGFRRLRVNVNSWVNQLGDLQSSVDYELNRNELNCFY